MGVLLASGLCAPAVAQNTCRAASGPTTRPLVELYTSEGCDSCPPADRWLSATFADGAARATPLAFHVDYWDRLGWKDRFASATFTARQHRAAEANKSTFVYTPQVLLQGRDFGWRDARAALRIAEAAATPARASVEISVARAGASLRVHAAARVRDTALRNDATLVLAYVDSALNSDVKAGENRGVRLRHDHVVRSLASGGHVDAAGLLALDAMLEVPVEPGRAPAIVGFVQRARDGDVLQTVVLPLTDCPPPNPAP